MHVETIQILCRENKLRWSNHLMVRLLQRGIVTDDVVYALKACEIIEQYPDAYPFSACLVLGTTASGKHLHVVCGASDTELYLITAYYPDVQEWESDFKTRKERL